MQRLPWPGWDQALIHWCAFFHAAAGLIFLFTPYELVWTEGTAPVLAMAPQHFWAVVFLAGAVLCWLLLRSDWVPLQLLTWAVVFIPGGTWLSAFLVAAFRGEVSGLGALVWFVLYGPWALAAVRVGLGKR